jgi:hypothetical protein
MYQIIAWPSGWADFKLTRHYAAKSQVGAAHVGIEPPQPSLSAIRGRRFPATSLSIAAKFPRSSI